MNKVRIYKNNLVNDEKTFADSLISVLNKNNISYAFDSGEVMYVSDDKQAVQASKDTGCYPNNVAENLYAKHLLPKTLNEFGFNIIESQIIDNPDNITIENFVVKQKNSSGSLIFNTNVFGGIVFNNKEAFKNHPLFNDLFKPNTYIAQKAISPLNHTAISLFCSVNSSGDCYFWRSSTDTWVLNSRVEALLSYQGYEQEKELLANAVKSLGIRNTMFTLQLIKDNDIYYPIDWNFRWGRNCHKQILSKEFEEYEKAILHMVGVDNAVSCNATDTWITNKTELDSL